MSFSNLGLSKRLERTEGYACAQFAEARLQLYPDSGAKWIECAETHAVFDGIESLITQTFGLGLSNEWSTASLDTIERFLWIAKLPCNMK